MGRPSAAARVALVHAAAAACGAFGQQQGGAPPRMLISAEQMQQQLKLKEMSRARPLPRIMGTPEEVTSFRDGCEIGAHEDLSGPLYKAWTDALTEANVTFHGSGSEALRALRLGANVARFEGEDLGVGIGWGSHDMDLFVYFPSEEIAAETWRWMYKKFKNHPDFECTSCCGTCSGSDSCCHLEWRKHPDGWVDGKWTKYIDNFNAIMVNSSHVTLFFDPSYTINIERMFPFRYARFGPNAVLPVPKDFDWYMSNKITWREPQHKPSYGQGCAGMAYPPFLQNKLFTFASTETRWDTYASIRKLEKGFFHCAKWLHQQGYASFYGCFDADVGFDEPEDRGEFPNKDWYFIVDKGSWFRPMRYFIQGNPYTVLIFTVLPLALLTFRRFLCRGRIRDTARGVYSSVQATAVGV